MGADPPIKLRKGGFIFKDGGVTIQEGSYIRANTVCALSKDIFSCACALPSRKSGKNMKHYVRVRPSACGSLL